MKLKLPKVRGLFISRNLESGYILASVIILVFIAAASLAALFQFTTNLSTATRDAAHSHGAMSAADAGLAAAIECISLNPEIENITPASECTDGSTLSNPLIGTDLTYETTYRVNRTTSDRGVSLTSQGSSSLRGHSFDSNIKANAHNINPSSTSPPITPTVSTSPEHACALDSAGEAYCWGRGTTGRLGTGTTSNVFVPVNISGNGDISGKTLTQISSSTNHTCALDVEGRAYCWGAGFNGMLGTGTTSTQLLPLEISGNGDLAGRTIAQISTSASHTCAVDTDGRAYCWGSGSNYKLGTGSTSSQHFPVDISDNGDLAGRTIVQIKSSSSHTCALDDQGDLLCWGYGSNGEIGNGPSSTATLPVRVNASGDLNGKSVTQVSAGSDHTCALDTEGRVYCWGRGQEGRLGTGSTNDRNTPVDITNNGDIAGKTIVQIQAGSRSTCAVDSEGGAYCWGRGLRGMLGTGSTSNQTTPVQINNNGDLNGNKVSHISPGNASACAVDTTGDIYCWGSASYYGILGTGENTDEYTPKNISNNGDIGGSLIKGSTETDNTSDNQKSRLISTSMYHSCLNVRGKVHCWGGGSAGALGDGSTSTSSTPVDISGSGDMAGKNIVQVSAGLLDHTCALDSNGKVYCWGGGGSGELGNGTTSNSPAPVDISNNGDIQNKTLTHISSGGSHTCAIDTNGRAYCWGANGLGQLGTGDTNRRTTPVDISSNGAISGKTLVSIEAGMNHTCAIDTIGASYCWGGGDEGKLGTGNNLTRTTPVDISSSGGIAGRKLVQISASMNHTCAIDSQGDAFCWGWGANGMLGSGNTSSQYRPFNISGLGALSGKTMSQISTGLGHTCAIDTAGNTYCWGNGSLSQNGTGATHNQTTAVDISGNGDIAEKTIIEVSSGYQHTCAIDTELQAYCWGTGYSGQLGTGNNDTQPYPSAIAMTPPPPPPSLEGVGKLYIY